MKKQLATVFGLAVIAGTVLGGGTAMAAPAVKGPVPGCVATDTWNDFPWTYAKATNNCGSAQRFYFLWDRAVDGGCTTLNPGWWRSEGRLAQARFAGLDSC
jgi:hypothetical protein